MCDSDIASYAGAFHGGEAGELLGITGALLACIDHSGTFRVVVFRIDSQSAIRHAFTDETPGAEGEYLLPAIMLCRHLRRRCQELGVCVRAEWISRDRNPAHKLAYAEQRRRTKADWRVDDDRSPVYFPELVKPVFKLVLKNMLRGRRGRRYRDVSPEHQAIVEGLQPSQ